MPPQAAIQLSVPKSSFIYIPALRAMGVDPAEALRAE